MTNQEREEIDRRMGVLPPATVAITRSRSGGLQISNVARTAAPPPVPPKGGADPVQAVLDMIDKLSPEQVQQVAAALGGGAAPPAPPEPSPDPPKAFRSFGRAETPRMAALMARVNGGGR